MERYLCIPYPTKDLNLAYVENSQNCTIRQYQPLS